MTADVAVATAVAAVLGLVWFGIVAAVLLSPNPAARRARALELAARAEVQRARRPLPPPAPSSTSTTSSSSAPLPTELAALTGVALEVLGDNCREVEVRADAAGVVTSVRASFWYPCPVESLVAVRTGGSLRVHQVRRSLPTTRSSDGWVDTYDNYDAGIGAPGGGVCG